MTIAASLSAAEIGAFEIETKGLDAKTLRAYLNLTMLLRIRGSLWDDEKYLANIAQCTRRFWRDRARPLLQDVFTFEGGRISHPEIARIGRPSLKVVPPELSEARRGAANKSWESRRGNTAYAYAEAAEPDANGNVVAMQNSMQAAAKEPAKSTVDAPGSDAILHAFASPSVHVASASLSPVSVGLKDSEEGRESGRAPRPATAPADATADAKPTIASHANLDAKPSAKLQGVTRLPDDWQPPAEITDKIRTGGGDPIEVCDKFRLHYAATGELRANWDAAYGKWWLMERKLNPIQSTPIPAAPSPNARPDPAKEAQERAAEDAACVGDEPTAQFARAKRTVRKGVSPVIYRSWLASLEYGGVDADGEATAIVQGKSVRDYVRNNYQDRIKDAWQAENPAVRRVSFIAADQRQ